MRNSLVTRCGVLFVILGLFACKDGSGPGGPTPTLSLSVDSVSVVAGGTTVVSATVTNSTSTAQFVSRDTAIARVSDTGLITGRAAGRTVVVGMLNGNSAVRDSLIVVVTPIVNPGAVLQLNPDSVGTTVGAATQIHATISGVPAGTPPAIQFVSRNQAIAVVDGNGLVTGAGVGKTVIAGTLVGSANARDSVVVTVAAALPAPIQLPVLGTGVITDRITSEVAVAGAIAYTSTWGSKVVNSVVVRGNAVYIWNVAGNVPMLVDSVIIPLAGTTGDVQISDDGALLVVASEVSAGGENGISIFNRANPTKPTLITKFVTTATRQGVHTVKLGRVNGRHYAFLNLNPSSAPAKLDIVDITDPANPVEVVVREMGQPYIHDVFVRDGILFAALWNTGMTIFDIGGGGRGGSPANPIAMGTVKTSNCTTCGEGTSSVHNVWWFHDPSSGGKRYAFIGEEGPANTAGFLRASGALHVVDVSDMSAPKEVAVYEPDSATTATGRSGGAHNFVMDEQSGILYAAFYNGGVRALDVRGDLGTCTAAQKTAKNLCDLRVMGREVGVALSSGPPKFIWGVALQGNNLYASDMANGIHKVNIAALKR
jgi:hypothetical protein